MRKPAGALMPRFLRPGDRVAVVAPSGVVDPGRLKAGLSWLRAQGHTVGRAPHLLSRHGYLAGSDEQRARDMNAILRSDPARAILFARGGYGLTRILDRLDLNALRRRPRLLVGYSDATALFMSLQRRGPYMTLYGPTVSEMGEPEAFDETSLKSALRGEAAAFTLPVRPADVLRAGRGEGRVLGGCLSLLVSLLGTPHDPDYRGAVLFWEDVAEPPYRIDRMLTQLRNAGKLDQLAGMMIGSLTECVASAGRPSLSIREAVMEVAGGTRFPIVWNVRAGHVARKLTLPLGLPATLDTRRRAIVFHPQV